MSKLAKVLILAIRVYQRVVSPLLPSCCRFYPSCSVYAADAIRLHGAAKGTVQSLKRLGRCHPWQPGGYDPVEKSESS